MAKLRVVDGQGPGRRFPGGGLLALVDAAVEEADWLTPADAPAVETLRKLAERMDGPDFPFVTPDGGETWSLDNVTEALFLKMLIALGMVPQGRKGLDRKEGGDGTKLGRLQRRVQQAAGKG